MNDSGMSKAVLIITIVVVLTILIGAGIFLKTRIDKLTAEPSPTPVSEVVSTPKVTPEPTPSFDRSKFTLRILNGTKTSGLAASVSAKLKDLGYTIGKTGNASNSAETTIRVKESAEGLFDALVSDLSADFKAVAGDELKDSDDADAEVTLGAE